MKGTVEGTPSFCSDHVLCPLPVLSHGLWPALSDVTALLSASVSLFVHWGCLPRLPRSSDLKTLNLQPLTLFLSSPKDVSGGDSCTSEEEPTFDPGYEPDWAVISTVRPQSRHSEPTRGRLSGCP